MRLLPPGRDVSPSQGYPSAVCCWYPFMHLGEERQSRVPQWSKVPCLRKQRDGRGLNTGPPDPEFEVLTTRPHTPPHFDQLISKPFFYSCYKPLPLYALLKPLAKIYKQRAYKWQFTGILIEIFLPINHLRQH